MPTTFASPERSAKIRATQLERWSDVRRARQARELLRLMADDVRERARHGDTMAKYVADRLDECL